MEKSDLTNDQITALEYLVDYYKKNGIGHKGFKVIYNDEIILKLMVEDLIFYTNGGYFPSTKAQDLINNL